MSPAVAWRLKRVSFYLGKNQKGVIYGKTRTACTSYPPLSIPVVDAQPDSSRRRDKRHQEECSLVLSIQDDERSNGGLGLVNE